MREFERDERADRLGEEDAERDGHGEFQVAVKCEENHEDDQHCEGTDDLHLVFRLEEFAVLAAPGEAVTRRQRFFDVADRALSIEYGPLQVAALDAVLHSDVARVVLAIDEGCAASLMDVGEFAQWDLLTGGRA